MRRTIICLMVMCLIGGTVGLAFGESEDNGTNNWKKLIASPSYGLNIGFFNLEYEDTNEDTQKDTLVLPGIDFRHFNGINVPRDGGFYYGYELGFSVNGYPSSHSFEDAGTDYTLNEMVVFAAMLMVKHGYRFDLGTGPHRPGFGFELGMGITAGGADMNITEDDDETETNLASVDEEPVKPTFELGIEGFLHRDEDSSFVVRLAVMAGMPLIDGNYGEMAPVRISIRGGFFRNH